MSEQKLASEKGIAEHARDITSMALDMGKGAVKKAFSYFGRESGWVSVEEPLDTTDWGVVQLSDEAVRSMVIALHEAQAREAEEDAA